MTICQELIFQLCLCVIVPLIGMIIYSYKTIFGEKRPERKNEFIEDIINYWKLNFRVAKRLLSLNRGLHYIPFFLSCFLPLFLR